MEKIAKEAGIAKGTLYLYFSSKEELTQGISKIHFSKLKVRLVPHNYFTTLDELLKHIEDALLIMKRRQHLSLSFLKLSHQVFIRPHLSKSTKIFLMKSLYFMNITLKY